MKVLAQCAGLRSGKVLLGIVGLLLLADALRAQRIPADLPEVRLSQGGLISSIAVQADGKVIVGGRFTAINQVPRNNLARINRNGSVDATWDPSVTWNGAPADASVEALAIHGDHVYLGGLFDRVGGQVRLGFARVGLTDFGTVDPAWISQIQNVVDLAVAGTNLFVAGTWCGAACRQGAFKLSTTGGGFVDPVWDPNPQDPRATYVAAIAVEGTNVFLGGQFATIRGVALPRLAKVSAEGVGAPDPNWRPAPNDTVFEIVRAPGVLYIGGAFTSVGGLERNLVARVSSSGSGLVDTNWNPEASGDYVLALAVDQQSVYVGGEFDFIGGLPRDGIARLSISGNGAADPAWNARLPAHSRPVALVWTEDGLYAGGYLSRVTGSLALGLARLDANIGAYDRTFPVQVETPGEVNALVRQPDGKLVIGGSFALADGLSRRNLVRVNADGTIDPAWNPEPNGPVFTLAAGEKALFVGGAFTTIGGQARTHLARLSLGNSDAADADWDAQTEFLGFVRGLALQGTNLYVCGSFTSIGGQARQWLAKLDANGNGATDLLWNPAPDDQVKALATDGTNLFVAGLFTNIGGRPRAGIAKLNGTGVGLADATWNPNARSATDPAGAPYDPKLLLSGGDLFVSGFFTNIGGQPRTNLAKLSTGGSGAADPSWNPHPLEASLTAPFGGEITALAGAGDDLFVAGFFDRIGGANREGLARLSRTGGGLADSNWNHVVAKGSIKTLLANGTDLYLGGTFDAFDGALRYALARTAEADPPVLLVEPGPRLVMLRNPGDGTEVTHFRVLDITGGTLLRSDGITPVRPDDFIPVEEAAAGLAFVSSAPTGAVTVASALHASPAGAGLLTTTATISNGSTNTPLASLSFGQAVFVVREDAGSIQIPVRKRGAGAATVSYATSNATAIAGTDFQNRSGLLSFASSETNKLITIGVVNDFLAEADEVFRVTLFSPSNALLHQPAVASVVIVDDESITNVESCIVTVAPTPRPAASGALRVLIEPAGAFGQWRLLGTTDWKEAGGLVRGLASDNYTIEFQPSPGYREPANRIVPVETGQTNVIVVSYALAPGHGSGELTVIIEPSSVAINEILDRRGQWQRQGEGQWRNSGETISGLNAGPHLIVFKPVLDRATPPPRLCQVTADQESIVTAGYLHSIATGGMVPRALSLAEATEAEPYLFNGQIQTALGTGSGVVVKERVVLTGAHVLFDDLQFSFVTEARWLFERHRDDYEPPAQLPRGWYVFDGYAARRRLEGTSGSSSPEAQQLDAAALYFVEGPSDPNLPGRGGYGGFLVSETTPSEWLVSARLAMLVGYPLDRIAETNRGRMHATTASNLTFVNVAGPVYLTDDIRSFPGNSGGPLYVQHDSGKFFPAAIYLGGLDKTVLRVIDEEVADLINRAAISGNGSGNNTGGGVLLWSAGTSVGQFSDGLVGVVLGPPEAVRVGAAWRVRRAANDVSDYFNGEQLVYPVAESSFPVEFKPIPGFVTPATRVVQSYANYTNRIRVDYPPFRLLASNGLQNGSFAMMFSGTTGRLYRVESSTNLIHWRALTPITNQDGTIRFRDPDPANGPRRFYRAAEL